MLIFFFGSVTLLAMILFENEIVFLVKAVAKTLSSFFKKDEPIIP